MNKETFKAIRLHKDMTQEQFGELLGMSKSAIANIEAGRRSISDRVRARLVQKVEFDDDLLYFLDSYIKLDNIYPL